jgi:hypothetical protein
MLETRRGPKSCPDRREIESGAFEGRTLKSPGPAPVDVFFAHIQGCARLVLRRWQGGRGSPMPARAVTPSPGSAACWSSAVKSPGRSRWPRSANGLRTIRTAAGPDVGEPVLHLLPGKLDVKAPGWARSRPRKSRWNQVALWRLIGIFTAFGTPSFVSAPGLPDFDEPRPFARLMIAQDTGTAIVGPARGDLFAGCGSAAGDKAGSINISRGSSWLHRPDRKLRGRPAMSSDKSKLSHEDRIIWARVARTVEAFPGKELRRMTGLRSRRRHLWLRPNRAPGETGGFRLAPAAQIRRPGSPAASDRKTGGPQTGAWPPADRWPDRSSWPDPERSPQSAVRFPRTGP